MGFFDKILQGLKKTKDGIFGQIDSLFKRFTKIDEELFEELEELLIAADCGALTASEICARLRSEVKRTGTKDPNEVKDLLVTVIADMMDGDQELVMNTRPSVVLVIGVNGVGKTTTIGKLAHQLIQDGKKVLLCAGDTFRAAAAEQLGIWAERSGADIVRHEEGSDPAAVVFDSLNAAKARGVDTVIVDTAGRLHNKANLMNELGKIRRIIDRELPGADVETLMVLDATTGQNGLIQAREFMNTASLTGIVLTKLDGTAKGGIVFAIANDLGLPVKYVGVGEGMDDLIPFDAVNYVEALFK